MRQALINCHVLPNGDLKVTAGNDGRRAIKEMESDHRDFWSIMGELFEPYFTNGSYSPFDAGEANPFVGLTSAPCIAEDLTTEDNGDRIIYGRFWYNDNYALVNELDELKAKGRFVYAYGGEGKPFSESPE
jgi:hypothetical protein